VLHTSTINLILRNKKSSNGEKVNAYLWGVQEAALKAGLRGGGKVEIGERRGARLKWEKR